MGINSMTTSPSLFGITNSNRDFSLRAAWGKNQFNNAFPVALACYMDHLDLKPVFLKVDGDLHLIHDAIAVTELLNIDPKSPDAFFSFEVDYQPFQKMVKGTLPRIDLVVQSTATDQLLCRLEVKLTALPDNGTADLPDDQFGCEIVVRPDTIVYQALSIAQSFQGREIDLLKILQPVCKGIKNWGSEEYMAKKKKELVDAVWNVVASGVHQQKPLVLQPVWKTVGKSATLADNCLDMFVWSDVALLRLYADESIKDVESKRIHRPMRSVIWLLKMLYDFAQAGRFSPKSITNQLSYSARTDKAFAIGGASTHKYMKCVELTEPRVLKREIKNIILGGGQDYLSPERRFDAIIVNSPEIFK
jgi:hypothetical protein